MKAHTETVTTTTYEFTVADIRRLIAREVQEQYGVDIDENLIDFNVVDDSDYDWSLPRLDGAVYHKQTRT